MIVTLTDGTERTVEPGSNTTGLRIKNVTISLEDTRHPDFLGWFAYCIVTHLAPLPE